MTASSLLRLLTVALVAGGLSFPLAARADNSAARLAEMERQIQSLTAELHALRASLAEGPAVPLSPAAPAPTPAAPHISFGPGLRIASPDGAYAIQAVGRLHADAAFFDEDRAARGNTARLRRARLGLRGNLGGDFAYRMEFDFASNSVNARDVFLAYEGFEDLTLRIGNMKPALGMEQATSSNDISFVERSPVISTLTRGHLVGADVGIHGDNWSFALGLFNDRDNTAPGADDEAVSVDARATVNLLPAAHDAVFHLGAGGSWRRPDDRTKSVTFSAAPAGVGGDSISTGALVNVRHTQVYGAEMAFARGPALLQGEYLRAQVSRHAAARAVFDGWYTQAAWLLTGEDRPYKAASGVFERIRPNRPFSVQQGDWGAFEILGRYDRLSLNDLSAGVFGGEMKQYTLGLNWYLRQNIRVMMNYTQADTDTHAVVADDDPSIYQLRTQFDF